jgi:molecular chaperone GrpE
MRDEKTIPVRDAATGPAAYEKQAGKVNSGKSFRVSDRRACSLDPDQIEQLDEQRAQRKPSYIEQLEAELQRVRHEARAQLDDVEQRLASEVAAVRQRLQREQQQSLERARAEIVSPMFEVFEAMERSVIAAKSLSSDGSRNGGQQVASVTSGLEMLEQLMIKKLAELGIERVVSIGETFDPAVHEAVAMASVDDPEKDGRIVAELSPGFRYDKSLIRAPKVQVGKLAS